MPHASSDFCKPEVANAYLRPDQESGDLSGRTGAHGSGNRTRHGREQHRRGPVIHSGELVGIFSERDLMRRVVAEGRDPRATCLAEVMTDDPLAVGTGEDLETCMTLMRRH